MLGFLTVHIIQLYRHLFLCYKTRRREENEKLEKMQHNVENQNRRPSRFEVIPAPDILKLREIAEMLPHGSKKEKETINLPLFGTQPKKSILKKTNSFNLKGFTPIPRSPLMTPYTTITGAESR